MLPGVRCHSSSAKAGRIVGASLLVILVISGCRSSVTQPPAADPRVQLDPDRDPGTGTIVLKTLVLDSGSNQIELALLGRNLRVEAPAGVLLDVSIANRSRQALYPSLVVWLSSFEPHEVTARNADYLPPGGDHTPLYPIFGFEYSHLLGDDNVLSPGEESQPKTWIFDTPDLAAFSFAANVDAQVNAGAQIAGVVFIDRNTNGMLEPDETPLPAGTLQLRGADSVARQTNVGEHGRYAFRVMAPGLYEVEFVGSPFGSPLPLRFTTPNPLQVVLLPAPDGGVRSFEHAHFGIAPFGPPVPGIVLTDAPPDSIRQDFYHLAGIELAERLLSLQVGFSGCSPDHPLQLFMSGGFMESDPVRARLVLMHDDRGELFDAAFLAHRSWDLSPLVRLYRQQYDTPEGRVILQLVTPAGEVRELLFLF